MKLSEIPTPELLETLQEKGLKGVVEMKLGDNEVTQTFMSFLVDIQNGFHLAKEKELRKRGIPLHLIYEMQAVDSLVFYRLYNGGNEL